MRFGFIVRDGNPEAPGLAVSLAELLKKRGSEAIFVADYGPAAPAGYRGMAGEDIGAAVDVAGEAEA